METAIETIMPPTLTELLRAHIPPGTQQKSIAMEWIARVRDPGTKGPAPSYVESRLSRCLNGDLAAVRYFFGERKHGVALLDVMMVPEAAREAIITAADALLAANGEPPARLVIDVTQWSDAATAKQLFERLRVLVIEPEVLKPAVLLLTSKLYDALPRSFDTATWLRVESVELVEAPARVAELMRDGALLASPTPHVDPERWLAVEYDDRAGTLALDPEDGLARFARDGRLQLPEVTHILSDYVAEHTMPFDASRLSAITRRRTIVKLRDERLAEQVDPDPRRRLAMANALGIAATATERDRIEAEVRAASVALGLATVETMSLEELEAVLAKARRRPQPTTIARIGDEIHVVNPSAGQVAIGHPRVRTHTIETPEPQLKRMRNAIADWTLGDFEGDPTLSDVMEGLDPDRRDVAAMLHARAWLFATQSIVVRPAKLLDDWRTALVGIFAQPPPRASLRFLDTPRNWHTSPTVYALTARGYAGAELVGLDEPTTTRLRFVPLPAELPGVPVDRDAPLHVVTPRKESSYSSSPAVTQLALPKLERAIADSALDELWLDACDAFVAGKRDYYAAYAHAITVAAVKLPSWDEADELLASCWLALPLAIDHGRFVRAANGAVLLSLGSGLVARIDVRETAHDLGPLRAMLDCTENGMTTGAPGGVVTYHIPRGVIFLQGRTRVALTFVASSLLLGHGHGVSIPVIAGAEEDAERERQRERDDSSSYDDDD